MVTQKVWAWTQSFWLRVPLLISCIRVSWRKNRRGQGNPINRCRGQHFYFCHRLPASTYFCYQNSAYFCVWKEAWPYLLFSVSLLSHQYGKIKAPRTLKAAISVLIRVKWDPCVAQRCWWGSLMRKDWRRWHLTQVGPETGVRDRRGERKGLANTIPMPIPACGFFFLYTSQFSNT